MSKKENGCNGVRGCTLGGIRIFSKLEPWEREEVAGKMHKCVFPAKSFVIRAGESGSDVYFLVSGLVRANSLSISGKAVHFEELREGAMFGEWAAIDSFIDSEMQVADGESLPNGRGQKHCGPVPAIRANDCEAIKNSVIVRMSCRDFVACINKYPSVCGAVLGRLAQMARKKTQLLYESYVYSMPQRVRAELVRIAEGYSPDENGDIVVTERITHEDIAQRIGGHREGVTIEIQFLNRAKIIDWTRDGHKVCDVNKLMDEELVPEEIH